MFVFREKKGHLLRFGVERATQSGNWRRKSMHPRICSWLKLACTVHFCHTLVSPFCVGHSGMELKVKCFNTATLPIRPLHMVRELSIWGMEWICTKPTELALDQN
ncbi:uncharacterized protein LOC117916274 [Vitis riparia]|uniref:uncharacterized protein LOC117916274 n=1 Tax=Vitis riparia TaxID=96939 RepID=UPI00155AFF53|nr:uncharacterized protein LOC117916274 [Vitis riparia]